MVNKNINKINNKPILKEANLFKDISEEELLEIYHEVLEIFVSHNMTYKQACDFSLSLMYALVTGAEELYDMEQ